MSAGTYRIILLERVVAHNKAKYRDKNMQERENDRRHEQEKKREEKNLNQWK